MYNTERLFEGENDTLYGQKPSYIVGLVQDRLDQYVRQRRRVAACFVLPDSHSTNIRARAGGTKDVMFHVGSRGTDRSQRPFGVIQVWGDDETMYTVSPIAIAEGIDYAISEQIGNPARVRFTLPIIDHHTLGLPFGGGMKNLVIVYR